MAGLGAKFVFAKGLVASAGLTRSLRGGQPSVSLLRLERECRASQCRFSNQGHYVLVSSDTATDGDSCFTKGSH